MSRRKERAQLQRIRAVALATLRETASEGRFNQDWLLARVAYYTGEYDTAAKLFGKALDKRYFDVGSAMALASSGDELNAEAAFRAQGFWIEGGSVEGHRLAAYAYLPHYALNVEEVFTRFAELDPDQTARLNNAARSTTKDKRLRMLARLANAQGRDAIAYKQVKAGYRDALAADIALRMGDLDTARNVFAAYRKSSGSSWFQPSGNATKATGFAGSAAVAHADEEFTRGIGWANKALELDKDKDSITHRQALLVKWACQLELGLEASKTLSQLRRAAPLQNISCGHLSVEELEEDYELLDAKRLAANEGDEAWEEDHVEAIPYYERALGLGRSVRQKVKLKERQLTIAARLLYALCQSGQRDRAVALARACVRGTPEFLNAWEVLAWCTRDKDAFVAAGLGGEWDSGGTHGRKVTLAGFCKRPVERAIRQAPATRAEHAMRLVGHGLFDVALVMFEAMDLAADSANRFPAAWACWTPAAPVDAACPVGRRYTAKQKRAAKRAWALLEPLILARWDVFYQRQPFDPWVLAVQLLHVLGDWKRLLEVATQCVEAHWSRGWYRPANVGIAPYVADAMARTRDVKGAIEHLESYLATEPKDRRLLESLNALGEERSLRGAKHDASARARELAFVAWRHEVNGEYEISFDICREASQLELDAMTMSNAANLLARDGEFDRADRYWDVASIACADVFPRFRVGGFLGKRAWTEWLRGRPRNAIPLAAHSFELSPTAGAAHTLALAYRAIGDDERATAAIDKGLAIDSRHEPLRDLLTED